MPAISQENRKLRITTPFGKDVLVPVSFTGTEALSRPFEFVVECVSESDSLSSATILGKGVTLILEVVDGTVRYLNGIVRRFSMLGSSKQLSMYRLELVPSAWFLSLGSDCRTFEKKTALQVIEAVCKEADVALKTRVTATPPTRDYIAQFNESNLDFVSRLMEELGFYYCFEHADGSHTMVVTDAKAGSIPQLTPDSTIPFRPNTGSVRNLDNSVFERAHEYAVHAKKAIAQDHDLLRVDSKGDASSGGSHARGEQFEFYGDLGLNRATDDAKLRIEEEERDYDIVRGKSTCGAFLPGTRFKLSEGPADIDGHEFHLVSVTHEMGIERHHRRGRAAGHLHEHASPASRSPRRTAPHAARRARMCAARTSRRSWERGAMPRSTSTPTAASSSSSLGTAATGRTESPSTACMSPACGAG